MSLEDELEPKLAELDRSARDQYAYVHLGTRGFVVKPGTNQLDFDPVVKGEVDPIWEVGMVVPDPSEEDLAREQTAYNDYLQQLEDLKGRFRTFYSLGDPVDFVLMTNRLGANSVETFPEGPGALATRGEAPINLEAPTALESVLTSYTGYMHDVDALVDKEQWTGDWRGDAAKAFHTGFLEPYLEAVFWHSGYIRELAIAVECYRSAIEKGREDIKAIADRCIEALYPDRDYSSRELGRASLIWGAVALFPPMSIPAGLVSLGTGLVSFLTKEPDPEPYETTISGFADFPAVLWSTWQAIDKLEQWLTSADETLSRGLTKDLADTSAFASPKLRLLRPTIADRTGERAPLGQLDFNDRPGGGQNAVVVELSRVYQAGYVNLPGAAATYNDAAAGINDCDLPAPLSQFFPRSVPKFTEARDQLAQIFTDTRDSLSDAGVSLVNTATNYELTDQENEELLTKLDGINSLFPPPVSY